MQRGKLKYDISAKVWCYVAPGGWHFVSLPQNISNEIRELLKSEEEGWGRSKATAVIGKSQWETAIWFDTKLNTYLLPLKADTKKAENIFEGNMVDVTVIL